ncbi:uncharacterized protein J3D65DRAFT_267439 [Phyllosticta citribraziliensis]|uniref:BRCT domain-containing protein n=1 Tax=Phyllosticta citribraziliensis TaxID=989973 RepID=A0ABR1M0X0_9PEZI
MRNPLKGLVIAASGGFGKDRSPCAMKRWVENNGGKWSTVINDEVTHLIADEAHWKDENPFVKDAKTRGNIHIVTWDWLDDSLAKQWPYAPKKYLWTTVEKAGKITKSTRKKEEEEKSEEVKAFEKGAAAAKRDLQSDNYHVYVDQTGFPYNVTLTRVNVLANTSERIELSLYESDSAPIKFHAVHIAYNGPNGAEEKKILVNPGADFDDCYQMFRAAFKRVCLIPWEDRLLEFKVHYNRFREREMHNRRRMEMDRFGETFTTNEGEDDLDDFDDEGAFVGDNGRKRKRRKKNNANDSDDERERVVKRLSPEDIKACEVRPFKYAPPTKGKPFGMVPGFNVVVGGDDMKADQEFLTIANL